MTKEWQLLKVGSDAEVFLEDSDGNPVPAVGLIGGTKTEPIPIKDLGQGFMLQEDNVTAEFNIPPCGSANSFNNSIHRMLDYLAVKMQLEQGLSLKIASSCHFKPDDLMTMGAQTFGCEPDFNAWTGKENVMDMDNPILRTMRTAAAHVHISFLINEEAPSIEDKNNLIKCLDLFLGVPSSFHKEELERKVLYGKAGACRYKPYGVEYRTLGNWWLQGSGPEWVFAQVRKAFDWLNHHQKSAIIYLNDKQQQITNVVNMKDFSARDSLLGLI